MLEGYGLRREEILQELLDSYTSWFDIDHPEDDLDGMLAARAIYHSRLEKFVLSKRAQLWAAESHEYSYIFSVPELSVSMWERMRDYTIQNGMALVKPGKDHMYSFLSCIVLADHVEPDAERAIRKAEFHKSFKFSIYGYSMLRAAVLDVAGGKVTINAQGRDLRNHINKIIHKER